MSTSESSFSKNVPMGSRRAVQSQTKQFVICCNISGRGCVTRYNTGRECRTLQWWKSNLRLMLTILADRLDPIQMMFLLDNNSSRHVE